MIKRDVIGTWFLNFVVALVFAGGSGAVFGQRIAHFPFDEDAGDGDPVAEIANGVSGALINPGLVTQGQAGVFGSAYEFGANATNGGGVNFGNGQGVKLADQFTVSLWFNAGTLDAFDRLVESMNGTAATSRGIRLDLGAAPGNRVRALYRDGTGNQNVLSHTSLLSTGQWYFAVVRFDSAADLSMTLIPSGQLVDAAAVGSNTESQASAIGPVQYAANVPSIVGVQASGGPNANAFRGLMDDVAFYNDLLSDADLANVYNGGASVIGAVAPPPPPAPVPFLGWDATHSPHSGAWQPSVGSGFNWNVSNGGASGPDTLATADGGTKVYEYSGDENVIFSGPAFNGLGAANSASLEMWIKPASLAGGKQVLWETGGVNGSSLTLEDATIRYSTANAGDTPTQNTVAHVLGSADEFVHVIGVMDQGTGERRLYVNGVEVGVLAGNPTVSWSGGNAAGLGVRQGAATGGFSDSGNTGGATVENGTPGVFGTFVGQVAAFNFHQAAIDGDGAALLFAARSIDLSNTISPGLSINWNAADAGDNSANVWRANSSLGGADIINWNLSGANNKPVLEESISTIHNLDAAYRFTGGDGRAAASRRFNQLAGGTAPGEDMTLEFWLKPSDLEGKELVYEAGGSGDGSSLRLDGDNLIFRVKDGAVTVEAMTVLSQSEIRDFIQVVVTVDGGTAGTGTASLFVNGLLRDAISPDSGDLIGWAGGEGDGLGSRNVNEIGGTTAAGGNGELEMDGFGTFDGWIAMMRYYRGTALDEAGVLRNYNAIANPIPEPGTIGLLGVCALGLVCRRSGIAKLS